MFVSEKIFLSILKKLHFSWSVTDWNLFGVNIFILLCPSNWRNSQLLSYSLRWTPIRLYTDCLGKRCYPSTRSCNSHWNKNNFFWNRLTNGHINVTHTRLARRTIENQKSISDSHDPGHCKLSWVRASWRLSPTDVFVVGTTNQGEQTSLRISE